VKPIPKLRRPITVKETKTLQKIRSISEKELRKGYKTPYLIIATIVGAICALFANRTSYDFLVFVFGTISVLSFSVVIFMPYEIHKRLSKLRNEIKVIDNILTEKSIEVTPVSAKRIALAKEFEDESDLYIIETSDDAILYLWDIDFNLKKNFPCLEFEIYNEDFHELIGRQISPLTKKIEPLIIDGKTKWAYLKKFGGPGHLTMEERSFDEIIKQINSSFIQNTNHIRP
jgi:hypothetical protein